MAGAILEARNLVKEYGLGPPDRPCAEWRDLAAGRRWPGRGNDPRPPGPA